MDFYTAMRKKIKFFITVMVLLTFVGQALAVVNFSCSQMTHDAHDKQAMDGMDHMLNAMPDCADSPSKSDIALDDCCADVLCSINHCISSSLFNITAVSRIDFYETGAPHARYALSYLAPDTLSLFRPPIGH
jgi:hypothetical protein